MKIKSILFVVFCFLLLGGCVRANSPQIFDANGNEIYSNVLAHYGYIDECKDNMKNSNTNFEDFEKVDQLNREYASKIYVPQSNPDYRISDYGDGICINEYIGSEVKVVIPEEIDEKKVLKIGVYPVWFEGGDLGNYTVGALCNDFVEEVILPATVKEISSQNFVRNYRFDTDEEMRTTALTKIVVDEENPYYISFGGTLFSRDPFRILCVPMMDIYFYSY